jgi:hypothetical protein
MAHIAEREMERLEGIPYDQLALTSSPVHSTDSTNPDYYITPGSAPTTSGIGSGPARGIQNRNAGNPILSPTTHCVERRRSDRRVRVRDPLGQREHLVPARLAGTRQRQPATAFRRSSHPPNGRGGRERVYDLATGRQRRAPETREPAAVIPRTTPVRGGWAGGVSRLRRSVTRRIPVVPRRDRRRTGVRIRCGLAPA